MSDIGPAPVKKRNAVNTEGIGIEPRAQMRHAGTAGSAEVKSTPLSPVDQILARPPQGPSLLDSRPAGAPVPRWMWLLPLVLALPGGIVGWLLMRESNPAAARALFVVGAITTLATVLMLGPTQALIGSLGV